MAARMEMRIARLAAVKAAEAAQKAAGAVPVAQLTTLSKVPTLHSVTATSLRSLDKLTARDLTEQLQIAEKGVVAMHDQWRQALNSRDPKWISACKAQHTARRARVEALEAELARRAAVAVATPAPAPINTAPPAPKALEETIMDMTIEALREQAQISLAAMHEAARLAGAGGPDAAAAAQRLRIVMTRRTALLKELADREGAPSVETPTPAPVEAPTLHAQVEAVEAPPVPVTTPMRDHEGELRVASQRAVEAAADAKRAARVVTLRQAIVTAWMAVDRAKAQQAAASWVRPGSAREADAAHGAAMANVRKAAAAARAAGLPDTHDRKRNADSLDAAREHAAITDREAERRAQQVADVQRTQEQAEDAERLATASAWLAGRTAEDAAKAEAEADAAAAAEAERQRLAPQQQAQQQARPTTPQPPRHHYPIPGVRRRD
jgi:hypothetical protein